jgi:hypothetical protein
LEIELADKATPLIRIAQLKINLCAVLSHAGKHELARDFAKGAIENVENDESESPKDDLLTTAYYNLGVEYEYLHDLSAAKDCFKKSKLAKDFLPEIESRSAEIEHRKLTRLTQRHKNSVMVS